MIHNQQRTIARKVKCSGVGLHSGKAVTLTVHPAPINHGIKFTRTDLPNCPSITAHFNMVVDTSLATVIGYDGYIVSTIEHLMAAFAGLSIDNALVELDAHEVPIMDGSAGPFTEMLTSVGITEQQGPKYYFVVKTPIELRKNGKSVTARPSPEFKITCNIAYDHPLVKNQSYTFALADQSFKQEIAPARTFGFLHEVEYLKRFGLARGGSLDNAIVLDNDTIVNQDGLRYADEFVRHKVLDCIGDFSLLGMPIIGHIILEKSGHAFNLAFLRQFFDQKRCWETRAFADAGTSPEMPAKSLAI